MSLEQDIQKYEVAMTAKSDDILRRIGFPTSAEIRETIAKGDREAVAGMLVRLMDASVLLGAASKKASDVHLAVAATVQACGRLAPGDRIEVEGGAVVVSDTGVPYAAGTLAMAEDDVKGIRNRLRERVRRN